MIDLLQTCVWVRGCCARVTLFVTEVTKFLQHCAALGCAELGYCCWFVIEGCAFPQSLVRCTPCTNIYIRVFLSVVLQSEDPNSFPFTHVTQVFVFDPPVSGRVGGSSRCVGWCCQKHSPKQNDEHAIFLKKKNRTEEDTNALNEGPGETKEEYLIKYPVRQMRASTATTVSKREEGHDSSTVTQIKWSSPWEMEQNVGKEKADAWIHAQVLRTRADRVTGSLDEELLLGAEHRFAFRQLEHQSRGRHC